METTGTHGSFWIELFGAEVRYRQAGDYRTRSIESGDGEPVILLHGISGHAETWTRAVVPLAEAAGMWLHALDMLGHGLTDKPLTQYSIDLLARHVLAFMDAIGAARAHVIGQSLGGWVAGWLASRYPDRVASLVSVTGAGLHVTDDAAEQTAKVTANVASATKKALHNPTRDGVRTRLEWLMHDKAVVTDELVETRYLIYTRPDFQAVAGRLVDAFASGPVMDSQLTPQRLAAISCPSLVLWTRQNPTMPWQVGIKAAELIPGASWYLMEDAGHWPQFEKPEEFNDVVGKFLSSVSGRSSLWARSWAPTASHTPG